jgi:hypothetical protein
VRFSSTATHRAGLEAGAPIAGGFTVEAWVALDAYPWNWVPIVDWERDMQASTQAVKISIEPQ